MVLLVACAEPPEPDGGFFSLDRVHAVALTIGAMELAELRAEPDAYVRGDVQIDDVAYANVKVRVKGRSGSFRPIDEKPGLKIDLDGQQFLGLAKLDLENLIVDCSCARERLAWEAIGALGLPAVHVAYAELRLNGEAYGLYGVQPDADAVFVADQWADAGGNLYDGDYVQLDDGFETNIDFGVETQDWFELDEGHDVGRADIHAVTAALDAGGPLVDSIGGLIDLDEVIGVLAAEAWLGQVDGYGLQANNYRVYFDPASARMDLVPWDMDFTFIDPAAWDADWHDPVGRLAGACVADADCVDRFVTRLMATAATMDTLDLRAELDRVEALIGEAVGRDPKIECTVDDHVGDVAALWAWIGGRSEQVRGEW